MATAQEMERPRDLDIAHAWADGWRCGRAAGDRATHTGDPLANLIIGETMDGGRRPECLPDASAKVRAAISEDRRRDRMRRHHVVEESRIFAGALGRPRPDLAELDRMIEGRGLSSDEFALFLSRRRGWEDRGRCQLAHLTMARASKGQPIEDSDYIAILRVLGTPLKVLRSWAPARI